MKIVTRKPARSVTRLNIPQVEPMAGRTLLESGVTNGQFGIEVWEPSGVIVHVGSDGNSYSNLDFIIKLYRMPAYTTLRFVDSSFVIKLYIIPSYITLNFVHSSLVIKLYRMPAAIHHPQVCELQPCHQAVQNACSHTPPSGL